VRGNVELVCGTRRLLRETHNLLRGITFGERLLFDSRVLVCGNVELVRGKEGLTLGTRGLLRETRNLLRGTFFP